MYIAVCNADFRLIILLHRYLRSSYKIAKILITWSPKFLGVPKFLIDFKNVGLVAKFGRQSNIGDSTTKKEEKIENQQAAKHNGRQPSSTDAEQT